MTVMNKVISNQSIYWDYKIQGVLDEDLLNEVIKFHQSSSVIRRDTNVYPYNNETLNWLKDAEFTDVLPNIYEDEIPLKVEKMNFQNSVRDFNLDMKISIDELSRVLYKSFGRSADSPSKRYPSAGALYPIIPILFLLEDDRVLGANLSVGAYILDTTSLTLKRYCSWSRDELREFLMVLNPVENRIYSPYLIGYAINMKKAVAKYKRRGYRHALIEIGLMAQCFRESCKEEERIGEFCWSGFDDNALTYNAGLNPRISPIALIQWFGKY